MEGRPTKKHLELLVGHFTFKDFNVANRDDNGIPTVRSMEMRGLMVASVYINLDASKHTDSWHERPPDHCGLG